MKEIRFKQATSLLSDLDEKKGIVQAYANVYDFEDLHGDISVKGSFDKTVTENFKRIRVLKDHIPTLMIGVPLDINLNDEYGLLTTTQFNMKKSLSRDMFTDIKLMHENGLNAELSVGVDIMKRDPHNKKRVTEYRMLEYSFLSSWASNELSTVTDIKSIKDGRSILDLITKAYDLDYSDSRLKQIELILKQITGTQGIEPSENTPDYEPLLNQLKQFKI